METCSRPISKATSFWEDFLRDTEKNTQSSEDPRKLRETAGLNGKPKYSLLLRHCQFPSICPSLGIFLRVLLYLLLDLIQIHGARVGTFFLITSICSADLPAMRSVTP